MTRVDVIRAWKDEEYRASLSAAELAELPAHPAGLIELGDTDLDAVAGGGDCHDDDGGGGGGGGGDDTLTYGRFGNYDDCHVN
ncbi:MAG TPA: mersacidin/lichenicidin family type 2 lantibiotic [Gemmatimonadales bacterium]|nr:mersacidin/lichenicidin family type 2 lantibiotic [Gemmatimonadales bacterium]